ncbi:Branched-chain amino acid ABC transporter permease [Pseudomonas savastanoi pv. glycinea]|uniref:Branched-chain amino acid ABC transporter permease n=1 Tax=Pseudomonas savastanoi pv. glycinea TaxID=318 RepID=A0A3M3J3R8_PSESG|nr:Branched-chain amino acid ABC transporter permease [Pseudomonas savastanoi pv. glycinea]RML87355.1 Branched-chain amino acid ABC transporter permease [Pseudomonas savastanoi pv. glycinea]RMN05309.1 Branched-chain amino acid ABC transporter permease [Pseudomonas savastanoi pv. glycinea]RMN34554.1 Branched-chain amino acid ABC transporter permease [Pseudomonas savastanoi pv. glycinea]RMO40099.1 Branched-chain amino acid ABC transporter permease [Pseudomonas savastanoi pv. glycinea]
MEFFFEVLIGGLLAGVMYSLVAIGFVLIYKASGVFNFAQGAMVLFAALTFVSLLERGVPFFWAFLATLASMVVLALLIERMVLRPLVNRPPIILFMATLGLSYMIEGLAQALWGAQVHGLELGIPDEPLEIRGMLLSQFDLFAAGTAAALVIALSLLFNRTRIGLSLRAVADDPLARWPWVSVCHASGRWSGPWPGLSDWWPGCSGGRGWGCSFPCHWWCLRRCRC